MMDTDPPPLELGAPKEGAAFMLTESHEFITNLLSYLPARDLCSCARVCRFWRRISERLLKGRSKISWSCIRAGEFHSLPDGDPQGHPMALFEKDVRECLKTMWSVPSQALVFTEFLTWKESALFNGSDSRSSSRGHKRIESILRGMLPGETPVLCLKTPGTIGVQRNLEVLSESESEGGISCLLLPNKDSVRVHQFAITAKSSKDLKQEPCRELVEQICGCPSVASQAKCILLFVGSARYTSQSAVTNLQRAFHQQFNMLPVIAGATVSKIEHRTESVSIGGLVFSGPNVTAASILLNESVATRKQAKDELQALKSLDISRGETVGFMFACIGRGVQHYEEENVESQVFRECFPNVPLFGLFGNGEIGCRNLTMTQEHREGDEMYRLPTLLHGYTTVMVLVNIR